MRCQQVSLARPAWTRSGVAVANSYPWCDLPWQASPAGADRGQITPLPHAQAAAGSCSARLSQCSQDWV